MDERKYLSAYDEPTRVVRHELRYAYGQFVDIPSAVNFAKLQEAMLKYQNLRYRI